MDKAVLDVIKKELYKELRRRAELENEILDLSFRQAAARAESAACIGRADKFRFALEEIGYDSQAITKEIDEAACADAQTKRDVVAGHAHFDPDINIHGPFPRTMLLLEREELPRKPSGNLLS